MVKREVKSLSRIYGVFSRLDIKKRWTANGYSMSKCFGKSMKELFYINLNWVEENVTENVIIQDEHKNARKNS